MRKKFVYGIIIGVVILVSAVSIAGNIMTQKQKDEEKKQEWANQNKNVKVPIVTYTPEELEKMRNQEKKDAEFMDEKWNKIESEYDEKDIESEKILKRFYKKDIKILAYGEAEARKTVQLIVDALNQPNDFSPDEVIALKYSISRRFETLNNSSDLREAASEIMGYNNTTANNPTPTDESPSLPAGLPKAK